MQFIRAKNDDKLHFNFTSSSAGGDRIYALPLIRSLGGGIIHGASRSQINFFKKQPYIFDVTVHPEKSAMLLWGYSLLGRYNRKIQFTKEKETLVESHFIVHNLTPPEEVIPWITSDKLNVNIPIVVHRTHRYRDNVDWSFLSKFRGKIVCIGYKKEVLPFIGQYKARWLKADSLEDLATIINSCQVFIGNQSTPLALATGLGKPRMIEECKNVNITIRMNNYQKKLIKAIDYYNSKGVLYPLANCTFNSENEYIMTNDANKNYITIKKILNNESPSKNLIGKAKFL